MVLGKNKEEGMLTDSSKVGQGGERRSQNNSQISEK